MTILLGLLVFGLLILIHEAGHFFFARRFGVQVNEFSIGMGPKLLTRRSKKTGILYSLRCLPIGGFVAMEGEDGRPEEEGRAAVSADAVIGAAPFADDSPKNGTPFYTKPVWQRMIITAAGAFMNLLLGALLMTLFVILTPKFGGTQVAELPAGSLLAGSGLQVDDTILRVDGSRVYSANDLVYEVFTLTPDKGADLLIKRKNGEQLTLHDVVFPTEQYEGRRYCTVDFKVYSVEKNFASTCKMAFSQMRFSVKSIWESLTGLITGKYGVSDLSGPVGVTEAIGEAAKEDIKSEGESNHQFLYLCAMITVNLGIFNLLPIPALDGGRLLFQFIELITRRPVPQKFETMVHFFGILLLLALMLLVTCKDLFHLFGG